MCYINRSYHLLLTLVVGRLAPARQEDIIQATKQDGPDGLLNSEKT